MGKRFGFLYEKIYEWDNLLNAFNKAKKGKSNKKEVLEFEYDLENILIKIQKQFAGQNYKFSGYKTFQIYEPKERLISCAPFKDRVIHHAICNIINPIIDKSIISDSYACRKGKGLHHAIKRAYYFYRNSKYVYKFDIQKYFYTIDHEILLNKLKRKIKDPRLLRLLDDLLATYNYADDSLSEELSLLFPRRISSLLDSSSYAFVGVSQRDDNNLSEEFLEENSHDLSRRSLAKTEESHPNCNIRKRGLPIGNLTSQLFANFYFSDFDHFCKERLKCKYYIRYMDDVLIFGNSKLELEKVKQDVEKELSEIRLHIHPNKNQISKTDHGINFLGFRFKDNQIRLQNRNLVRFKHKLHGFASREISIEEIILSFNGHLGYFNSGHCRKIISNILDEYEFTDGRKVYKLAI